MKKAFVLTSLIVCVVLGLFAYRSYQTDLANTAKKQEMINETFRDRVIERRSSFRLWPLRDLLSVRWDGIHVFTCYQSPEGMYNAVGYRWRKITSHDYEVDYTLVFMDQSKVIFDIRGPLYGIGLSGLTHTLLNEEDNPMVLIYPSTGDTATRGAQIVACPPDTWRFIAEDTRFPWIGKWGSKESNRYDEMTITHEGIVYLCASIEGLGTNQLFVKLNDDGSTTPIAGNGRGSTRIIDDFAIALSESNGEIAVSIEIDGNDKTGVQSLIFVRK
jgi:hypothetical protein